MTALSPNSAGLATRLLFHWFVFTVALAAVLFGAAGTLHYWQAWSFLAIHFGTSAATNLYLIRRDPALLARRLKRGAVDEPEPGQKVFQVSVGPLYLGLLAAAAVDHRFGWSVVPASLTLAGQGVTAAGFLVVLFVFRENSFCSRVVEVAPAQTVICTGPYRVVRHPMYAGVVLGALGIPLALGSYWALLFLPPIALAIALRLSAEERFLRARLPGYLAYTRATRYRLVPGAW